MHSNHIIILDQQLRYPHSFALYHEENGTGTTLISAIAQCPVRSILDHLTIAMIVCWNVLL